MSNRTLLQAEDTVVFVDSKEREYLRTLKAGGRISLRGSALQADQPIGLPEGSRVCTARNEPFWVFRPTYAHLIPNLPRRAQVIYPKDVGVMLLWGDVFPGASALRPGGVVVGYVATVVQVKALVDELRAHRGFAVIEVMENLLRFWHVKDLSVRPEHRMVAHTGFIIVARRVHE